MPHVNCTICNNSFYAKPRHIKIGWGKYCSKKCQYRAQHTGKIVKCFNCKKDVYRQQSALKQSQSKNFFCNKSCFAIWKNQNLFCGKNHRNWKDGEGSYRAVMLRSKEKQVCNICNLRDTRVLVVHHIDKNRKNNSLENLVWVCRNCHCLVHSYNQSLK